MKLIQFGCGGNYLDGWENHDIDVDLTKLPLPFPDNHADSIFIEHCLEHFTVAQAWEILQEFKRILKPGGKLRVCCPVLERLDREQGKDICLNHGHLIIFSTQSLKDFIRIAGFNSVVETKRKPIDGHWKVKGIGIERDNRETARIEAIK